MAEGSDKVLGVAITADLTQFDEGLSQAEQRLERLQNQPHTIRVTGVSEDMVRRLERAAAASQHLAQANGVAPAQAPTQQFAHTQNAPNQNVTASVKLEGDALARSIRAEIESALREPLAVRLQISNLEEIRQQLSGLGIGGPHVVAPGVHQQQVAQAPTLAQQPQARGDISAVFRQQMGREGVEQAVKGFYDEINKALKQTGQAVLGASDDAIEQFHQIAQRFGSTSRDIVQVGEPRRSGVVPITGGAIKSLADAVPELAEAAKQFSRVAGPGLFPAYRNTGVAGAFGGGNVETQATASLKQTIDSNTAAIRQSMEKASQIANAQVGEARGAVPGSGGAILERPETDAIKRLAEGISRTSGTQKPREITELIDEVRALSGGRASKGVARNTALSSREFVQLGGRTPSLVGPIAYQGQDLMPFMQAAARGFFNRLGEEQNRGKGTGRFIDLPVDMDPNSANYGSQTLRQGTRGPVAGYQGQFRALRPQQALERVLLGAGLPAEAVGELLGPGGAARPFLSAGRHLNEPGDRGAGSYAPGSSASIRSQATEFARFKAAMGQFGPSGKGERDAMMQAFQEDVEAQFHANRVSGAANRERIQNEATFDETSEARRRTHTAMREGSIREAFPQLDEKLTGVVAQWDKILQGHVPTGGSTRQGIHEMISPLVEDVYDELGLKGKRRSLRGLENAGLVQFPAAVRAIFGNQRNLSDFATQAANRMQARDTAATHLTERGISRPSKTPIDDEIERLQGELDILGNVRTIGVRKNKGYAASSTYKVSDEPRYAKGPDGRYFLIGGKDDPNKALGTAPPTPIFRTAAGGAVNPADFERLSGVKLGKFATGSAGITEKNLSEGDLPGFPSSLSEQDYRRWQRAISSRKARLTQLRAQATPLIQGTPGVEHGPGHGLPPGIIRNPNAPDLVTGDELRRRMAETGLIPPGGVSLTGAQTLTNARRAIGVEAHAAEMASRGIEGASGGYQHPPTEGPGTPMHSGGVVDVNIVGSIPLSIAGGGGGGAAPGSSPEEIIARNAATTRGRLQSRRTLASAALTSTGQRGVATGIVNRIREQHPDLTDPEIKEVMKELGYGAEASILFPRGRGGGGGGLPPGPGDGSPAPTPSGNQGGRIKIARYKTGYGTPIQYNNLPRVVTTPEQRYAEQFAKAEAQAQKDADAEIARQQANPLNIPATTGIPKVARTPYDRHIEQQQREAERAIQAQVRGGGAGRGPSDSVLAAALLRAGRTPEQIAGALAGSNIDRVPGADRYQSGAVLEARQRAQQQRAQLPSRSLSTSIVQLAERAFGGRAGPETRLLELQRETGDLNRLTNRSQGFDVARRRAGARYGSLLLERAQIVGAGGTPPAELDAAIKASKDTFVAHTTKLKDNEKAVVAQTKKVNEFQAVGKGDILRNLGAGFVGGIGAGLVTGGLSAVMSTLSTAVSEGLVPQLDRLSGNNLVAQQTNKELAGAISQANYAPQGLQGALTAAGFGASAAAGLTPGLTLGAAGLAGAQQLQTRLDYQRTAVANLQQSQQMGLPQGVSPITLRNQGAFLQLPNPLGGFINFGGTGPTTEKLADSLRGIPTQGPGPQQNFLGAPTVGSPPLTPDQQSQRDLILKAAGGGLLRSGTPDEVQRTSDILNQNGLTKDIAGIFQQGQVTFSADVKTWADAVQQLDRITQGRISPEQALVTASQQAIPNQLFAIQQQTQLQLRQNQAANALGTLTSPPLGLDSTVLGGRGAAPDLTAISDAAQNQLMQQAAKGIANLTTPVSQGGFGVPPDLVRNLAAVSQEVASLNTQASEIQLAQQTRQWNRELVLAQRNVQDLAGLTGQANGSEIGQLERLNLLDQRRLQVMQLQDQQRQLNYTRALASFTYQGATPEEAADRLRIAREQTARQQQELDINKGATTRGFKIVDEQNLREFNDAIYNYGEVQKRFVEAKRLSAISAAVDRESRLQAQLSADVNTFLTQGAQLQSQEIALAQQIAETSGTLLSTVYDQAVKTFRQAIADMETVANGGTLPPGDQNSPTNTPTNPDHHATDNAGQGGHLLSLGARSSTEIHFHNVSVRNDDDITQIARKVEDALNRKAALLGIRRL